MEKKTYEKPVLVVEQFVANNYCRVCQNNDYLIHCYVPHKSADDSNNIYETYASSITNLKFTDNNGTIEENNDSGVNHRSVDGTCGASSSYEVSVNNGTVSIKENSKDLGNLPGTIIYPANNTSVGKGSLVLWSTTSGGRTWHHWGYIERPTNHS